MSKQTPSRTRSHRTQRVPACPCDSGRSYLECCQPCHSGQTVAASAEALMRSRYSAYVLADEAYLLRTWAEETRPESLGLDEQEPPIQWRALKVLSHQILDLESAEVSFEARFRIQGRGHKMRERSLFVRRNGQWFYVRALDETPDVQLAPA